MELMGVSRIITFVNIDIKAAVKIELATMEFCSPQKLNDTIIITSCYCSSSKLKRRNGDSKYLYYITCDTIFRIERQQKLHFVNWC